MEELNEFDQIKLIQKYLTQNKLPKSAEQQELFNQAILSTNLAKYLDQHLLQLLLNNISNLLSPPLLYTIISMQKQIDGNICLQLLLTDDPLFVELGKSLLQFLDNSQFSLGVKYLFGQEPQLQDLKSLQIKGLLNIKNIIEN